MLQPERIICCYRRKRFKSKDGSMIPRHTEQSVFQPGLKLECPDVFPTDKQLLSK